MFFSKRYLYIFFRKIPVTNDSNIPPIPQEATNVPKDTAIESMKISEDYKDQALELIKSLVSGNKSDPEKVELKAFEGEILHFQAENMLNVITNKSNRQVPGQISGAVKVDNEVAANEAMNKAYLTLADDKDMEKQIRDVILNRPDKGFAVDNVVIPLTFWKKEFVVTEPCQGCKATGSVTCLPCSGKGLSTCPRCHGTALVSCTQCNGAQMVAGPNGQNIQCPICHGRGKTGCNLCGQSGRIQCKTCGSQGTTTCPSCQGNAWGSVIHTVELQIRTEFDYPKNKLPEKVVALIEKYGEKINEFATINIAQDKVSVVNLDDEEKAKQQEIADKRNDLRIAVLYEVILPYGHIEYDIDGKSYYTFLFGNKATLTHVSPFLDDLIKNGIRKLQDAAENRGDVHENLKMAGEYRTVKEGIIFAASNSLKKAKAKLKKANSLGLSNNAMNEIISYSDRSLKNITKKPRMIGLGISALLNFALLGIYFLTPLRDNIVGNIDNSGLRAIIDAVMFLGFMYIGVMAIQITAESAIKKTMAMLLPGGIKTSTPRLGNIAYWNILACISVFFIVIELSRHLSFANSPEWYLSLLAMI